MLKFQLNILLLLLPLILICNCNRKSEPEKSADITERTKTLALENIIIDSHIDLPYRLKKRWEDVSQQTVGGHFDYPRARAGGLNAAFMAVYIPPRYSKSGGGRILADSLIDLVEKLAQDWPDKFQMAYKPESVRQLAKTEKFALCLGMENGTGLDGDLENLKYFFDRGIRYITLAHGKDNRICDSSYDDRWTWDGLSPFGREVIREMNRLGMMIDVSHVSDSAFYQILRLSQAPVIASHSSCRHFTPGFERNMSDEMIHLLADQGGIVQVNFGSYFVSDRYQKSRSLVRDHINSYLKEHHLSSDDSTAVAYISQYRAAHPVDRGDVGLLADHIDHIVSLVGIEHVGFGSDFDGVRDLPAGMENVSKYPNLIAELLRRGYSEPDIKKICGENLLRVWEKVRETGKRLQKTD